MKRAVIGIDPGLIEHDRLAGVRIDRPGIPSTGVGRRRMGGAVVVGKRHARSGLDRDRGRSELEHADLHLRVAALDLAVSRGRSAHAHRGRSHGSVREQQRERRDNDCHTGRPQERFGVHVRCYGTERAADQSRVRRRFLASVPNGRPDGAQKSRSA